MKKQCTLLFIAALCFSACNLSKKETSPIPSFEFKVEAVTDTGFNKLPALQSFVFGNKDGNWIMFAGRTNGFHGFGADRAFPVKKANSFIYAFNTANKQIDSMPIPAYGGDTGNVFLSTNLAHTQDNEYLYACGGYGVISKDSLRATKTYDYFMKIKLNDAIAAVKAKDGSAFKKAISWGRSYMVASTGGELFKLPDGKFYMAVGHNFAGPYVQGQAVQVYTNNVYVFDVKDGANQKLDLVFVDSINDKKPSDISQFRRRDLVVAPSILANDKKVGLAIYGGVFDTSDRPYHNPIYIDRNKNPQYIVDSFMQWTNIYSTAFMSSYDPSSKTMMTSLFGGIGDDKTSWNEGNWTNKISTNIRNFANGMDVTTSVLNKDTLPGLIGSEGVFIPTIESSRYFNDDFKIMDYSKLSNGQKVGYIYAGIRANDKSGSGPTSSSNKIYQVTLIKK